MFQRDTACGVLFFFSLVIQNQLKKGGLIRPPFPKIRVSILRDLHHVFGLRPFWTVGYFEFNFLALDQGFVPVTADGAVVNENILFAGLLDKSVALCIVKPFDLADCF